MIINITTHLVGWLYAALVTLVSILYPKAPTSALFVVIGNLLIAGYLHQKHGARVTRSFLVANILLGAPQIILYQARTLEQLIEELDRMTLAY